MTERIPEFIQLAEEELRTDDRVRSLQFRETLSVSTESVAMPSDFRHLVDIYHDGATFYGPIEIVPAHVLAEKKALEVGSDSGVIAYATHLPGRPPSLRFSPIPDTTYSLSMLYERDLDDLGDSTPSNWLLDDHAGIYLYASLMEAAPYLKNDARIQTWGSRLEQKLEKLHKHAWRQEAGGRMVMKPRRPIG